MEKNNDRIALVVLGITSVILLAIVIFTTVKNHNLMATQKNMKDTISTQKLYIIKQDAITKMQEGYIQDLEYRLNKTLNPAYRPCRNQTITYDTLWFNR